MAPGAWVRNVYRREAYSDGIAANINGFFSKEVIPASDWFMENCASPSQSRL